MFRFRRMQPVLVSVLTVAVFVVGTTTTLAVKPNPTPPGNHLNITEVEVNFDTSMIVITGEHFSFGNTLDVTLGEFGSLNIVGVPTDTEIVVDLPAGGFPEGVKDYLLTVSRGTGQSQNDEYDLTVLRGALGTCPCEGTVDNDGTVWDTTFPTNACGSNLNGNTGDDRDVVLLNAGPTQALRIVYNVSNGPRCENAPNNLSGLTQQQGEACRRSLLAIAAEDGIACVLP